MGKTEFNGLRVLAEFVLCICAITIGFTYSNDCDTTMTTTAITMKKWLIVRGIFGISMIPILSILFIGTFYDMKKQKMIFMCVSMFIIVLIALFACAWYIAGFVVLFYSNIECFNAKEPMAVYMACDLIITSGLAFIYHVSFRDEKNIEKDNKYDFANTKETGSSIV